MKRILFFCLMIASTIFAMEGPGQGQNQLHFPTTAKIFANLVAFYDLPHHEVLNTAINVSTESENSVFNAVILWAFKNCRNADELKNLLLTIRFQDLDETFIDHVVKKTHLLFAEKLFGRESYHEQKAIVLALKSFYLLAKKSKYEKAEVVLKEAQEFGYERLLDSRVEQYSRFFVHAMFHGMDKWKIGSLYLSAPSQFLGYHFLFFIVLEKSQGSSSIHPMINVKCRSEILFQITQLYTNDELINLGIEEGEEIEKISLPVGLEIGKLFSLNVSTKAFLHCPHAEFAHIKGILIKPVPMKVASFSDALAAPISYLEVASIKAISKLVATMADKDSLRIKINKLDANSLVRARVLALLDKEQDPEQKHSIVFSIQSELATILNDALVEEGSDGRLTFGLWLRITNLTTDNRNNNPLAL